MVALMAILWRTRWATTSPAATTAWTRRCPSSFRFPPWVLGTLGAFIRIRAPIPHRQALFDIGIAGPLAGFVVVFPFSGSACPGASRPLTTAQGGGLFLGDPLLFQWVSRLIHGPLPENMTLGVGSLGLAAWFGLFVTALNLMPIGQLDGGHVTYSVLHGLAYRISRSVWWVCVALVYFGPNWLLWAVLLRVLGRRHPPDARRQRPRGTGPRVDRGPGPGRVRRVLHARPPLFSWSDFFDAVGLGKLLGR